MKTETYPDASDVVTVSSNDYLSVVRTVLANERTGLAYGRTALMLFATGLTFIKLFPTDNTMVALGIALLPLSLVAAIAGVSSFVASCRRISGLHPKTRSHDGRIARFLERFDDTSVAVVFAEAGDQRTALAIMQHAPSTLSDRRRRRSDRQRMRTVGPSSGASNPCRRRRTSSPAGSGPTLCGPSS